MDGSQLIVFYAGKDALGVWSHRRRGQSRRRPDDHQHGASDPGADAGQLRRRRPAQARRPQDGRRQLAPLLRRASAQTACSRIAYATSSDGIDLDQAGPRHDRVDRRLRLRRGRRRAVLGRAGRPRRRPVLHRHRPLRLDARRQGERRRRRLPRRRPGGVRARQPDARATGARSSGRRRRSRPAATRRSGSATTRPTRTTGPTPSR